MNKKIILFSLFCLLAMACSNDDEDSRDMEKPSIDMGFKNAYPQNCVILYRGESFPFRAVFTDNEELGNYNIEIHNNFDHHSHSTDDVECDLEPKKTPVKAFVYNQDFSIPLGKNIFEADNEIFIPEDVDTGDYHFMVRLTDKAGWQQLKAISLKIKDRN
ncbi:MULTISPECIES: DUF4625 domain-containing protein [unclassified Dysgonomonas]|jgi:hypothetical protein|uniref:DUF4625 domain-containing protein n=1 Tax=unclassified Dysgonomonas TaxID=2630389 RepID=UPI0025BFA8F8|nr:MULTISPECIES: DUF4625 domain-containing protein [unclassified Dysgonomonas]MDR2002795.1 DUF4625 domain-containing protein [Prevotella sp.]HMM03462.1 DUF4625 domain-containing protein [Dysgonomonas sp.]